MCVCGLEGVVTLTRRCAAGPPLAHATSATATAAAISTPMGMESENSRAASSRGFGIPEYVEVTSRGYNSGTFRRI